MTDDTSVTSNGSSLATQRLRQSLNEKIPTNSPLSTTKAAFLLSDIFIPASNTLVWGLTMVVGIPTSILRSDGDVLSPKAFSINGANSICKAAAWDPSPPWEATTSMRAPCAAEELLSWDFSSLLIASFKHFAMSSTPTTPLLLSVTGRCRKPFETMVVSASIAESSIETQVGFNVAILDILVEEASSSLATNLLVISVSVTMPARPPSSSTTRDEDARFDAISFATARAVSLCCATSGFLGRSLDTGRSSSGYVWRLDDFLRFFGCLLSDRALLTEVTSDMSSWDAFALNTLEGGIRPVFDTLGVPPTTVLGPSLTFVARFFRIGVERTDISSDWLFLWSPETGADTFIAPDGLVFARPGTCTDTFVVATVGTEAAILDWFSSSILSLSSRTWISRSIFSASAKRFSAKAVFISFFRSLTFLRKSAAVGSFTLNDSNFSMKCWISWACLKFLADTSAAWSFFFVSISSSRSNLVAKVIFDPSMDITVATLLSDTLLGDSINFVFSIRTFFSNSSIFSWSFPADAKSLPEIASSSFSRAHLNSCSISSREGNKDRILSFLWTLSWRLDANLKSFLAIASSIWELRVEIWSSRSARDSIPSVEKLPSTEDAIIFSLSVGLFSLS